MHAVDPSGVSYRFFATAIGKGKNGAKSQLEKLDLSTLTAKEAVIEAAKVCDNVCICTGSTLVRPLPVSINDAQCVWQVIYSQHDPSKDKPIELEISW